MRWVPRRFQQPVNRFKINLHVFRRSWGSRLVVSGGMPRSGSTLMFNMVRLVATRARPGEVSAGFESNIQELPASPTLLVKTHDLTWPYRWRAGTIFYSFRDLRTVAVSAQRKFGYPISIERLRHYVRDFQMAEKVGATFFRYETLVKDPESVVEQIGRKLQMEVDVEEVLAELSLITPSTNGALDTRVTQLHADHFTHTGDDDWREVIPPPQQREINREFAGWFRGHGYPLS